MRKAVIFDLDGTLTQSEAGIWNCVRYACEALGYPVPDAQTLRKFVGPPLKYSFKTHLKLTDEAADICVAKYRERYTTVGLFENRVYDGIPALLQLLRDKGCHVAIATGKPQGPSERIIEHFGLSAYFASIVGPDDSAPEKEQLIRRALPEAYDAAWMVGDTRLDILGGKAVGITTVGVGYGYGTEDELHEAGCDVFVPTVADLIAYFEGQL